MTRVYSLVVICQVGMVQADNRGTPPTGGVPRCNVFWSRELSGMLDSKV